ncbi:MAG: hypothetical protein IKX21_07085 [Deltaproteobacteria bacterium]|nr:hypothetical protein [Deltaproteobacteria bacterium]
MRNEAKRVAPKNAAGRGRVIGKGTGMKRAAIASEAETATGTGDKLSQGRFLPDVGRGVSELAKSGTKAIVQDLLNPVSTNAFKGRGALWMLRRVDEELASVDGLMKELVSISCAVPGREIRYSILKYKGGRKMLRWRLHGHVSGMTDEAARKIFEAYPEPKRGWYLQVLEQGAKLNTRRRQLMTKRNELQKQLPTAPVYAREPVRGFLPLLIQKRHDLFTAAMA